ncbi:ATP-binding protein [uncultured Hymenobacter sp.]|uniref:sensor histidine kinase n=1 Tax=uncultured Hymenobacter sp. TaxID=170016 RepID=UPI0035CB6CEF
MRITLAARLLAGLLLLLGLFAAVVLVNYRLAGQVLRNSQAVETSQQISAEGTTLLRNIIDMETGFRGYLLIGNEQTLDPYYAGQRELAGRFNRLRDALTATSAAPAHLAHLDATQRLFRQWARYTDLIISEKREVKRQSGNRGLDGMPHRNLAEGLTGKQLMDGIRGQMMAFEREENANRQKLSARLASSISVGQGTSVAMAITALVAGALWALYLVRLLSRRLSSMITLARRLAGGDYKTQIVDAENDEVSELANMLNLMARTIDTNISQLESRNRELDQFAYVVSHDLKAPLRGIESASRWIEEDLGPNQLPAHIREFLKLMRQRVHRMENLITGILELARVGRVEQANETVFVRQLLREILDMLQPPAGLQVELPFFLPTLVTNRVQLQQVFANLLSNAIKYHDHPATGQLTIGCDDAGEFYRFTVADDGPGIAPEYHERIFVIFQTLTERDTLESTGVGLAIVKKIVERQGGRIFIDSAEGAGARFVFTWPKQPLKTTVAAVPAVLTIPTPPSVAVAA